MSDVIPSMFLIVRIRCTVLKAAVLRHMQESNEVSIKMKKELRERVYKKYNGHCAYCGKEIDFKDMQVDHQLSQRNGGGNELDNLFPACRLCNHYKRAQGLESFRETMLTLHDRIVQPYINRVALDYGIMELKPFDGYFYFEKQ